MQSLVLLHTLQECPISKEETQTPRIFDLRGQSELAALHELRHGALEYLFDNTDLKNQKYFKNYDIDVEEDIMDMIDNRIIKEQNIP